MERWQGNVIKGWEENSSKKEMEGQNELVVAV